MNDNLDPTQVPSGEQSGAATPAAPVSAEPVAPATPSAPSSTDVERQNQIEAQLAKYEADIRAIKSSSDKRFSDAEKNWKQQNATLQKELQTLRLASMDEDERKLYESSLAQEKQQEIVEEVEQLRRTATEYQANINAIQYFLHQGVPADKLVIDQGYDALFNSGMEWMSGEVKRARSMPAQPSVGQPNPLPTPPTVASASSGVPNTKPTWADLRAKYGGDEEKIYRLVEAGILPGDIIPS